MRGPFHSLSSHKEERETQKEGRHRVIRRHPGSLFPLFSSFSLVPLLFFLFSSVSIVSSLSPLLACGQISPDHRRMGRGQEPTLACAAADFLVPSRMQYSVFSLFSSKPLPPPPKKANKYSMYRPATLHPILFSALPIPFLVGILAAEVWIFILLF
jgi:hypothetical protein